MKNIIQSVKIRGLALDKWLLKLEKRAFGWHFWSSETEDQVGFEVNEHGGRVTHKYIQWLEFRRKANYSGNFLFNLTEVLSKIFSFLRRLLVSFIIHAIVVTLILGITMTYGCNDARGGATTFELAKWLAVAYAAGLLAPSLLFAGLGFLWRKLFKVDQKLQAKLRDAGYSDDLTDLQFVNEN